MPPISIANLRAAGLNAEQIVKVLEDAEAERREKERIKKRNQRACPRDGGDSSPSLLLDTTTTLKRERARPRDGGDMVVEFNDVFWPMYPHKVAKPAALKAFQKARKRASLETIMAGLAKYAAKTDDRHWANASTWLNNDRWADEPGPENGKGAQPVDLEQERVRRAYFALQDRQREVAKRMRAQGATKDEINTAIWSEEVAGEFAASRAQQG